MDHLSLSKSVGTVPPPHAKYHEEHEKQDEHQKGKKEQIDIGDPFFIPQKYQPLVVPGVSVILGSLKVEEFIILH
jgi:hypothetical protein